MLIEILVLDEFISHEFFLFGPNFKKMDFTTCVNMRLEYVLKHKHYCGFNDKQTWEDLCDHLKASFIDLLWLSTLFRVLKLLYRSLK